MAQLGWSWRALGRRRWLFVAWTVVPLVLLATVVAATSGRWRHLLPQFRGFQLAGPADAVGPEASDDDHAARGATDAPMSLEVSEQGRKSIGLTLATVELRDYSRTASLPAMVIERPGRSESTVSASMTGIVMRIEPARGEAVRPGDPLFELRLTHEDLVEKQSSLLRAVEELDVLKREIARLKEVTASGAVAGKALLERQYEQQRLEAALRADRQALVLHGLSEEQVASIIGRREMLSSLTLTAPPFPDRCTGDDHDDFYEVAQVFVKPGDHVTAGTPLAALTDYCSLHIEGSAFEHDAPALNRVLAEGGTVSALIEGPGTQKTVVEGLRLLNVENRIDPQSRALKFYVALPNELLRNETTPEGHRFIAWRFRPGQRVAVLVPMEQWAGRIVLPLAAVVQEGVESFVFMARGRRFERKSVHVEHRDAQWAVIENDGTLFPGDAVAANGAYQIHLAMKAQAGGGPDPHAGHGH